jgi:hypothetical protein
MAQLSWDVMGNRLFETGVDHGVIWNYNADGTTGEGTAWSGLITVSEAPDGAEETALYADNIKYGALMSAENFKGSITAYMYPEAFEKANGEAAIAEGVVVQQQARQSFGFAYRVMLGNDTIGTDLGYKLHLVYGAKVSPSSQDRSTINDSPAAAEMSWDFTTTPVSVTGFKPTAHLVVDSTEVSLAALQQFEDLIYGTTTGMSTLPTPDQVAAIFEPVSSL